MRTIADMARQEVFLCMTSIVFAMGNDSPLNRTTDLGELCAEAKRLLVPVEDYEEGAIQEGWKLRSAGVPNAFEHKTFGIVTCKDWADLCITHGISPYEWEVFECWAVSQWLHDELKQRGARVSNDFGNLCIWSRTTTGQAIYADSIIADIYGSTHQGD